MLRESSQIAENMDFETKYQKAEIKLKIKDAEITKLREQVVYRNDLIEAASKMMK
jgi:hypothetical protein